MKNLLTKLYIFCFVYFFISSSSSFSFIFYHHQHIFGKMSSIGWWYMAQPFLLCMYMYSCSFFPCRRLPSIPSNTQTYIHIYTYKRTHIHQKLLGNLPSNCFSKLKSFSVFFVSVLPFYPPNSPHRLRPPLTAVSPTSKFSSFLHFFIHIHIKTEETHKLLIFVINKSFSFFSSFLLFALLTYFFIIKLFIISE